MKKFILGDFQVNTYLLNFRKDAFLIDPGYEGEFLRNELKDFNLKGILLTHGHLDHIDQIGSFTCPIYIHKDDIDALMNENISGYTYFGSTPKYQFSKLNIVPLDNNSEIFLGSDPIKVIHTPGHTKGSSCFLYQNRLFTGDTLFRNDVGRTDLLGGNNQSLRKSINYLFDKMPDYIKIYPGHGENSNIKYERENNLFYKSLKK